MSSSFQKNLYSAWKVLATENVKLKGAAMEKLFNNFETPNKVLLTEKEQIYLKSIEPIIICPDPDWPPFEYFDEKGDFFGIAADLLALIFKKLQVSYRYIQVDSWEETLKFSQRGTADLLPFLNRTPQREQWLLFSDAIFVDPNVFVSRLEYSHQEDFQQLNQQIFALPHGTAVEKFLKNLMPTVQIINTASELEAFKMIIEGRADLSLRSLMVSAYTIGINNFKELKIAAQMSELTNYLRIGVLKEKPMLCQIINKAIATISPQDQARIVKKNIVLKLASLKKSISAQMMLAITMTTSSNWYWNYRLQKYNQEYGILLDNMWTHVWYYKDSRTYGKVNNAHAEFLGLKKQDLEHKKIIDVLPWEIGKKQIDQNEKALEKGIVVESEDWFLNHQGERRLLQINRVPRLKLDRSARYLICSAVDITERRKMEQQIFFEKEQLRKTLLAVSDGVISTDKSGVVLMINQAAANLVECSPAEAVNKHINQIFSLCDENQQAIKISITDLKYKDRISFDQNLYLIKNNGKTFAVEGSLSAIREGKDNVVGAVFVFRDVSAKRAKEKKDEFYSQRDPLTALYNRRFFEEKLARLDLPASLPFSLLMIDVNGLKLVNDAFGHQIGDEMLKKIAKVLAASIRQSDIIARIGGDEFVILLPQTNKQKAVKLKERMIAALQKQEIKSLPLSVSCGVGTKKSSSESMQEIFNWAEKQMYREKNAERKMQRMQAFSKIANEFFASYPAQKRHSAQVSLISEKIATALKLSAADINQAALAGKFHDLGKMPLSPDIIKNMNDLSPLDQNEYQRHPDIGYNILFNCEEFASLSTIVLAHHENWDGSGYPNGLKGSEIPLLARIVSIANTYDNLINGCSLKSNQAIAKIQEQAALKFDPQITKALLSISLA